jgi:di/tricarboxylate transporter
MASKITMFAPHRRAEVHEDHDKKTWEIVYTIVVLFIMFAVLLSERASTDSVMLTTLAAFVVVSIVDVKEAFDGFANKGVAAVLVLFIVAEGINKTGALDWYMNKLLGRPKSIASAQLRLMVPIVVVSAFMNNTPIVVVMIPIVLRWARTVNIPRQQLLIHLSYSAILGGTCTMIGTSTNLVVSGLIEKHYPDEDSSFHLFSIGKYGVPVAIVGIAYTVIASPFLLPGANGKSGGSSDIFSSQEDILLGARVTPWSPAAGRTVQRSGLRDTGGIYLVSVKRALTGNLHTAVSRDFVLNVGDILYFTGLVETFGEFCEEHALEMYTTESADRRDATEIETQATASRSDSSPSTLTPKQLTGLGRHGTPKRSPSSSSRNMIAVATPTNAASARSLFQSTSPDERLRLINRIADLVHRPDSKDDNNTYNMCEYTTSRIVVSAERELILIAIDAADRQSLLLDVSKALLQFDLQLHHTEAAVIGSRSLSVWRCEATKHCPDIADVWDALYEVIYKIRSGFIKQGGSRVIRVQVLPGSSLVSMMAKDVDFRTRYGAALVSLQRRGKSEAHSLAKIKLESGDELVLQVSDESPLLCPPNTNESGEKMSKSGHNKGSKSLGSESLSNLIVNQIDEEVASPRSEASVWNDLRIIIPSTNASGREGSSIYEFLTATVVTKTSNLIGMPAVYHGLNKLPGIYLVSIERPTLAEPAAVTTTTTTTNTNNTNNKNRVSFRPGSFSNSVALDMHSDIDTHQHEEGAESFPAIDLDEKLMAGDILWFSGPASSVSDLRMIQGLKLLHDDEVEKLNERPSKRRLYQAVVARHGPLVGKTVKEVRFRTHYGAAVIAVHREGRRVHDFPGNVRLQGGDILLLEAGSSFVQNSMENNECFALFTEVENSAPPRTRMLWPALIITVAMLVVAGVELVDIFESALVAAITMVAIGILSEQEARNAIKWDVIVSVACSFGISTAIVNSGTAAVFGKLLVRLGSAIGIGNAGLIGSVYLATFLTSSVVPNNAAAALMFPIALYAAENYGTDRITMSYTVMFGASASFMTSFGYQCNLLVYSPGGYTSADFLRFGTPLQILLWVFTSAILSLERWYWGWVGAILGVGMFSCILLLRGAWMTKNATHATKAS